MRKNIVKAGVYSVGGITLAILSIMAMIEMYLSTKFLPVYVNNTFVLGNKVLRYELYILLIVGLFLSAKIAAYGISFLIKKVHKEIRRR